MNNSKRGADNDYPPPPPDADLPLPPPPEEPLPPPPDASLPPPPSKYLDEPPFNHTPAINADVMVNKKGSMHIGVNLIPDNAPNLLDGNVNDDLLGSMNEGYIISFMITSPNNLYI